MSKGILITIEGTDGSGKGTQAKKIYNWFKNTLNQKVKLISFPGYSDTFFGSEVGKYLNGEYGDLQSINPKMGSLLYALDRFERSREIKDLLLEGYTIICDRYVDSNIAYQCSLLKDSKESALLSNWLKHVEYSVLEIPKPDMTIFLDVEPDVSRKLVLNKAKREYTDSKEDIMESSKDLIERSYSTYKELAKTNNWFTITCTDSGNILESDDITVKILNSIDDFKRSLE